MVLEGSGYSLYSSASSDSKKVSINVTEHDFDFWIDEVPYVSSRFDRWGYLLQQIPRSCAELEKLDLHLHEMDMDDIEEGEWVCKDLKKLRIRIKGLDTPETITKAIELWRSGVRERWRMQAIYSKGKKTMEKDIKETEEGKNNEERSLIKENIDTSIEARVARHLLKFEKLQKVWLGYRTWVIV
ncbi:hypothetical protein FBU30_007807 [Linnemannia zychae]|nr:hypothetical protein FBU30_007807 [Linnemannia zychae]